MMECNYSPPSHYESTVTSDYKYASTDATKQTAFAYMDRLEGWCSKTKASVLLELIFMIKPKTIVEIGVWGGKSLVPMACGLKALKRGIIYGIDPWDTAASIDGMDGVNYDWWGRVDHLGILRGLEDRIWEFGLGEQITLLKTTSEDAPIIPNIDILHVDGNHSEKASTLDVLKWVPLVRKGGFIVFDDTTWGSNAKAVEWLNETCIKIAEYHESNDWGIWVKP